MELLVECMQDFKTRDQGKYSQSEEVKALFECNSKWVEDGSLG